ncbi:unnamed protein product, partial [marine sediment metagenome]
KFTVTRQTIDKWSKNFNWRKRVEQRDIELAKKIEKKTDDVIVNTKAQYREDIKKALSINKALINTAIKDGKLVLQIVDVDGFKKATDIISNLIKTDLLLLGEADQKIEIKDDNLSELSVNELLRIKKILISANRKK